MIAIILIKFKKNAMAVARYGDQVIKRVPKFIKIIGSYWTMGRYDAVWIVEVPNEEKLFEWFLKVGRIDMVKTETMFALTRGNAVKFLPKST